MAILLIFVLGLACSANAIHLTKRQLVTCPGFPGYCSESYPGGTCTVVCAFGRPNVPECQKDGTWTDVPRCIEHVPGNEIQLPNQCPGIPGYCSDDYHGAVCEFDCLTGPDIRSFCTPDGTWEPYPVCEGDIRETRDGCDGCPGPFGGPRNRTAEAAGGGSNGNTNKRPTPLSNNKRPSGPRQGTGNTNRRPQGPTQQAARPSGNRRGNGNNRKSNGGSRRNGGNSNGNGTGSRRNNNFGQKRPQAKPLQASRPKARPLQQQQRPKSAPLQSQQRPVQQVRPASNSNNRIPSNGNNGSNGRKNNCPGGSLDSCIDVCPSFSARIFGACVGGCARRCPAKK